MQCFPDTSEISVPWTQRICSLQKEPRKNASRSPEPVLSLGLGPRPQPREVEMRRLLPSCFSPERCRAPGRALATLTSRDNILATDSRPRLQLRCHTELCPSTNSAQRPPPGLGAPPPVSQQLRSHLSCPQAASRPQGQTGPGRPSQTPLIFQGAVSGQRLLTRGLTSICLAFLSQCDHLRAL